MKQSFLVFGEMENDETENIRRGARTQVTHIFPGHILRAGFEHRLGLA